jgi:Zinc carboxypeptidase
MTGKHEALRIDADFPGGNVILEKIDGGAVFLRQDVRDTQGDWCYWAFRVRGAAGHRLRFHFTGSDVLGVRGPVLSRDGGRSWHWLGDGVIARIAGSGRAFSYELAPDDAEVFFAFCPLYTEANLRAFLTRHAGHSHLRLETLCRSRQGRAVELLRLEGETPAHRILLTGRHHACEAVASYVLEGVLEATLAEDELGSWLRQHVAVAAVPFVDKDGVEAGDQGKNRWPYDHNRDYGGASEDSIYPEVRALRAWAPQWLAAGRLSLAIDLHSPWIRGPGNEDVFFVGGPDAGIWERVLRFSSVLEHTMAQADSLPFQARHNLPFGQSWNTLVGEGLGQRSCAQWIANLPHIHFGTTLEVPYANAGGAAVTPASARALGRALMTAMRDYLESSAAMPLLRAS